MLEFLPQVLVNGIVMGAVYAVIGLSFAIIYSTLRVLHFAHGIIFITAPYVILWFSFTLGVPLWAGIMAGTIIAVGLSLAINALIYEPLRSRGSERYLIFVASLGAFIILQNLITIKFNSPIYPFQLPFVGRLFQPISLGDIYLTPIAILILGVAVFLFAVMYLFFRYTKLGVETLAVGHDPELAEVLGIRTKVVRYVALGVGTGLTALPAILWSTKYGYIDMETGWTALFIAFFSCILAGQGKIAATAGAGFIMGIVWNLAVLQLPAKWAQTMLFLFVIVVLWIKPEGLFGTKIGRMAK